PAVSAALPLPFAPSIYQAPQDGIVCSAGSGRPGQAASHSCCGAIGAGRDMESLAKHRVGHHAETWGSRQHVAAGPWPTARTKLEANNKAVITRIPKVEEIPMKCMTVAMGALLTCAAFAVSDGAIAQERTVKITGFGAK